MIERLTRSITTAFTDPRVKILGLTVYYLAILGALMVMSARGAFSTPAFIYQGF